MPTFKHRDVSLNYEVHGSGYPLLLFAPGGLDSRIGFWDRMPYNPIRELSADFQVIAWDQRNAGKSFAPVEAADWRTHARDALALLDHLRVGRTHIMGGCIGSSYCLGFIKEAGQERVSAAVLQNPVGLTSQNKPLFEGMFLASARVAEERGMSAVLAAARAQPEWRGPEAGPWSYRAVADPAFATELEAMEPGAYAAVLREYAERMFGADFVFSVTEDFVRDSRVPLLILAGNDDFHPTETAERIAALAPNAELMLQWREPEFVSGTVEKLRAFLQRHTPDADGE